jgi:hypothetical protein
MFALLTAADGREHAGGQMSFMFGQKPLFIRLVTRRERARSVRD